MKKLSLVGLLLFTFQLPGYGETITFDLQPSDTLVFKTGRFSVFSNDLNGRTLNGQALSLDLLLNGENVAKLFLVVKRSRAADKPHRFNLQKHEQIIASYSDDPTAVTFAALRSDARVFLKDARSRLFSPSQ